MVTGPPSGPAARVEANLAALRTLRGLQDSRVPATDTQRRVLAGWTSWGAVPAVFDDTNPTYSDAREQLHALLSEVEWAAASRTTINAHYTDPAYAQQMWRLLTDLGLSSGPVLEPGCGSGTFLGHAPPGVVMTGVELDPVTAAIAARLHPEAQVRAESFADTRLPEASFDAAIGNVPFSSVRLHDPVHNAGRHAMHNHFILKSLHLVKPGGTVAVLTSHYTLDAQNPAARREIADLADLIGAVRLPTGAHRVHAGTDVVTDLLVLRRREAGADPAGDAFEQTRTVQVQGGELAVNEYFLAHPDHVGGTLTAAHGQYRNDELRVVPGDRATADYLAATVDELTALAREAGLTQQARALAPEERRPVARVGAGHDRFVGHLAEREDGQVTVRTTAGTEDLAVPAAQHAELHRLLGLRDQVVALLQAEAATTQDTPQLDQLRATLAARYHDYLTHHGPINRLTQRRTGRTDPDTGTERMAQIRPAVMRIFGADPFAPTVRALETYDPHTGTANEAPILSQRVVAPRQPHLGADTPADAVAICLDTHGEVRLPEVARLLGTAPEDTLTALGDLVYDEPGTGRLVPAAEYLSGNVRAKHAAAMTAAAGDDRYTRHVTALAGVIPPDLGPAEIDARLGAAWIGAEDVQAFLVQTLDDRTVAVLHTVGADWQVRGGHGGVLATAEWGTERVPAPQLAQALLKQAPIQVTDEMEDGSRVVNPTETAAAQDKARELNDRFAEWVWEDPARADRLVGVYNERFNAQVLRSYDTAHMSLPGLAKTFTPRPPGARVHRPGADGFGARSESAHELGHRRGRRHADRFWGAVPVAAGGQCGGGQAEVGGGLHVRGHMPHTHELGNVAEAREPGLHPPPPAIRRHLQLRHRGAECACPGVEVVHPGVMEEVGAQVALHHVGLGDAVGDRGGGGPGQCPPVCLCRRYSTFMCRSAARWEPSIAASRMLEGVARFL